MFEDFREWLKPDPDEVMHLRRVIRRIAWVVAWEYRDWQSDYMHCTCFMCRYWFKGFIAIAWVTFGLGIREVIKGG